MSSAAAILAGSLAAPASIDVENTCPRWFNFAGDPQLQQQLLRTALGEHGDYAAKVAQRREVSPVQLLAMIYYNRGIDRLSQRRFPEALAANAQALRLDPANTAARGNLLATLNNWAIALGEAGQYREAAAKIEEGMALDPAYPTLAPNYAHVHYRWVERLCENQRFQEALDVLRQAAAHAPKNPISAPPPSMSTASGRRMRDAGRETEALRIERQGKSDPFLSDPSPLRRCALNADHSRPV